MNKKMIYNKKYVLWLLLFGIFCMQVEQVQANIFYDEKGKFTIEGYTFSGAATVAAIAIFYKGYIALYPQQDQTVENEDFETISCEEKKKSMDVASLLCAIISLEIMTLAAVDAYIEEYVRSPMRKKKIADGLLEKELLNDEAESEWMKEKGLARYSILSNQQVIELLKIKLQQIKTTSSVKIPLIAHTVKNYSGAKLIELINESGLLAIKRGDGVVDMSHVRMVQNNFDIGYEDKKLIKSSAEQMRFAYHEAGHAVIMADKLSHKGIVDQVTIVPRRINFFAGVGGFTRSFPVSENDFSDFNTWTDDDLMSWIMMYYAGGVSEQVFEKPYALKGDERVHGSLSDFNSRRSVGDDKAKLTQIARALAIRKNVFHKSSLMHMYASSLESDAQKYIEEGYRKTFAYILSKKAEVEKVAKLVMDEKTIDGQEVYKIIGKSQPLYSFEREGLQQEKFSLRNDCNQGKDSLLVPEASRY